ncbi:WXG100 family type VII secretion target [Streptacidiphilus fuscans]|uniref:WXG100 family type VII secretion target n=1 Tax=Streptacidiphilus fuscans TaxID=2789292 RepID=A0A931AXW5_9ACTN|nr:WXG100 family type VII secretion target [Streptacidiphilus fuscans]MBF9067540.1 WXG100 family type VII secretion target [Streptacidiphilus fuscans]
MSGGSNNWIGGDFAGLQHMGATLTGAVEPLQTVIASLDSGVDSLVSAAGWQGDAATQFRKAWTTDSITAGGYSDLVGSVGKTLSSLGDSLSSLNDALYNAAQTAKSKGLQVGPHGEPLTTVANASDGTALNEYTQVYEAITLQAENARVQAATALQGFYAGIDPDQPMQASDKMTVAAFLRDLYATSDDRKSAAADKANEELEEAERSRDAARAALKTEVASLGKKMEGVRTDLSSFKDYKSAVADFKASETELNAALDSRNAFSKLVNFKTGDLDGLSELLSKFKYAPDFLKDIPVLDVAAALTGSGFEAIKDHDEGWSWTHSILVDGGAAVGGVLAGVGLAAAAPEGLAGAAYVGATSLELAGAVAVGVGIDKAVHEHWSEDVHDHGVVGGLAYGSWNVVKGTGKSMWGDVTGAWHGITSLF